MNWLTDFTVQSQQDSRTNLEIAVAAKLDSSSLTTITLLATYFLPANFVAVSTYDETFGLELTVSLDLIFYEHVQF
jgi:hypothetical protein